MKWKSLLLILTLALLTSSCGGYTPSELHLKKVVFCTGLDERGQPVGINTVFSPTEEQILVYGYTDINKEKLFLQVTWNYEGEKLLYREVVETTNSFHSTLHSENGFRPGTYHINVLVDRVVLYVGEFEVE